ncbi:hypothetical protein B7486_64155, partial [cyanobacterium TDX16]
MEQFFADAYYELGSGPEYAAVFLELYRLYMRVIAFTTNWISERRELAGLGRLMRHALADGGELSILTFNHDLLIESAVFALPRRLGSTSLLDLYDIPDQGTLGEATTQETGVRKYPIRLPRGAAGPKVPVKVRKLHGSLNWGFRTTLKDPSPDTLFKSRRARQVFLDDSSKAYADLEFDQPGSKGRKTWYFWPLIVPPIYDKHSMTKGDLLKDVWDAARSDLQSAERLVFLGYSFPDSDMLAKQMFRRGFSVNSGADRVYCINPDPSITGRLHEILAPDALHL